MDTFPFVFGDQVIEHIKEVRDNLSGWPDDLVPALFFAFEYNRFSPSGELLERCDREFVDVGLFPASTAKEKHFVPISVDSLQILVEPVTFKYLVGKSVLLEHVKVGTPDPDSRIVPMLVVGR